MIANTQYVDKKSPGIETKISSATENLSDTVRSPRYDRIFGADFILREGAMLQPYLQASIFRDEFFCRFIVAGLNGGEHAIEIALAMDGVGRRVLNVVDVWILLLKECSLYVGELDRGTLWRSRATRGGRCLS